MAVPTLTLEAAFDDNPLATSPTWTDISSDLRAFKINPPPAAIIGMGWDLDGLIASFIDQ